MSRDLDFLKQLVGTGFKKKEGANPKAPDFTIKLSTREGRVNVMDVAIWKKKNDSGETYYSFSFNDPYVAGGKAVPQGGAMGPDEDIPF